MYECRLWLHSDQHLYSPKLAKQVIKVFHRNTAKFDEETTAEFQKPGEDSSIRVVFPGTIMMTAFFEPKHLPSHDECLSCILCVWHVVTNILKTACPLFRHELTVGIFFVIFPVTSTSCDLLTVFDLL